MPNSPRADAAPALVAGHARAVLLTSDGELLTLSAADARARLGAMPPPLVVHLPATARRLGLAGFPALDLLELFAFTHPARGATPTPRGLALALGLDPPEDMEGAALRLGAIAGVLLGRLAALAPTRAGEEAAALARALAEAGWAWAPSVGAALRGARSTVSPGEAIAVWRRLPAFEERNPRPAPSAFPVPPAASRARLAHMLGADSAPRAGQADYAHAAAAAFAPRETRGDPILMLAEAGTGTGKTLGYLAPASLWAERNGGAVTISTFTRHLQRQIEREVATRLHTDPAIRRRRVVVRKGRENYLCLLNFEETARGAQGRGRATAVTVPTALLARWAMATGDGDITGGDLPGWFRELFGASLLAGLADRRGECIHGACPHYTRCFVEHGIRRARDADLVVANHALVMTEAANGGREGTETRLPTRYVFDEGHHIGQAADAAFAVALSGSESAELRRWLLGAEGASSRARGLRRRLDELVVGEPSLETPLDAALLAAAQGLAAPGWTLRLTGEARVLPGEAANPTEALLALLRRQVEARTADDGGNECDLHPLAPGVGDAAASLGRALERVRAPLETLVERLAARLDADAETLDATTRGRIEAMTGVIRRRALNRLDGWIAMLGAVAEPPPEAGTRREHVHFLRVDTLERATRDGAIRDVALCRHWLDPTLPFALSLAGHAHGLLVTSATLRDQSEGPGVDAGGVWEAAEARAGASHLPSPAIRAALASPFDYARQTRCFVVTDLPGGDSGALAGAYRTLFLAAGGGALGLFTAISRLRAVYERIAPDLEAAGLPLLAQHVDAMDNATLVDVFRVEENSCLLGTDAMRDGVDVPGAALRLVVFERVPWMRPDILHRERRLHLSGGDPGGYDDRIVRLRLRQAFGRLIRTETDRGVFVLLDRRMPSRFASAFPRGVAVERVGLAAAVAATGAFLAAP